MKSYKLWIKLTVVLLILIEMIYMEPVWHDGADGQKILIDTEANYNWYQAWNECARYDAQLIVIDSEVKNQNLIKLLKVSNEKSEYLWIGGNVYYEKISFHWAPTEQEFNFTNWLSNETNQFTVKKQCVYLMRHRKNFPWNIVNCDSKKFGFICEEIKDTEETVNRKRIKAGGNYMGTMYNGSIYELIG